MGNMSIKHIGNLDDQDVEEALNDFLRNALPLDHDVSVEFGSGVATIRGSVASLTAAQAIEELVMAHDGVESVINHLALAGAGARAEESRRPA